jgi:hypothetical protein
MSHFAAEVTKKERPPLSSSGFPQEILPKREILLMLYIDSAHVLIYEVIAALRRNDIAYNHEDCFSC